MRHNKPRNTTRYLKFVSHNHPLAQKDGKVYEHRFNLYQKIGRGTHKCEHCGKLVTWGVDLLVDHLDSDKWNNSIDNLVPSCSKCIKDRDKKYVRKTKSL